MSPHKAHTVVGSLSPQNVLKQTSLVPLPLRRRAGGRLRL